MPEHTGSGWLYEQFGHFHQEGTHIQAEKVKLVEFFDGFDALELKKIIKMFNLKSKYMFFDVNSLKVAEFNEQPKQLLSLSCPGEYHFAQSCDRKGTIDFVKACFSEDFQRAGRQVWGFQKDAMEKTEKLTIFFKIISYVSLCSPRS